MRRKVWVHVLVRNYDHGAASYLFNVDIFIILVLVIASYVVALAVEQLCMSLDGPLQLISINSARWLWRLLTFVRLTLFPTSSFAKNFSILEPIFSYDGTGAWISTSVLPSLDEGSKPDGKQHMNATERWPSGVSCNRKRSSSTVSPSTRSAASMLPSGSVGKDIPVARFSHMELSFDSWKMVGKRLGSCSDRRYV